MVKVLCKFPALDQHKVSIFLLLPWTCAMCAWPHPSQGAGIKPHGVCPSGGFVLSPALSKHESGALLGQAALPRFP